MLTIELAQALFSTGQYFAAIALYEQVHEPGPHVREEHIARALRGMGYALIELGSLGLATWSYKKSQDYEPDNEIAANQLEYISRILDEKRASGSVSVSKSASPEHVKGSVQAKSGVSDWSSIGFPLVTGKEFKKEVLELTAQAVKNGISFEAERGRYIKWSTGVGPELWIYIYQSGNTSRFYPHFSGNAKMRFILQERAPFNDVRPGYFVGWVNTADHGAENKQYTLRYPLIFRAPDYDLHLSLDLPVVIDVQLLAFAQELHAFSNEADYYAYVWSRGLSLADESISPWVMPPPLEDWGYDEEQSFERPRFMISGHVLETSRLTNPVTGVKFCWAKVRTIGGELDIVADPRLLDGTLVTGGVIYGAFSLSGRLLSCP